MSIADRVRVEDVRVLSDDWYVLKKTTFAFRRNDGTWQRQSRETYDRGDGAAILLFDPERRTVILVKQFRYPAFVNGHDDLMIEAAAGLLDDAGPEERIRAEAQEETGYTVREVRKVFEAFMSPGAVTEKLHFFLGRYTPAGRTGAGGGHEAEGEDIEVLEVDIDAALAMIGPARSRTPRRSCCCSTRRCICSPDVSFPVQGVLLQYSWHGRSFEARLRRAPQDEVS